MQYVATVQMSVVLMYYSLRWYWNQCRSSMASDQT